MFRTRTSIAAAAVVLAAGIGAGAGVGGYAAFSDNGKTTTVVQQVPVAGAPAAVTKSGSVADVYKTARDGVVEVVTATSGGSSSDSPFPFGGGGGGSDGQRAQGSGFVYDGGGHVITNYHVVQGAS